jgi:hypothetical protein
VIRRIETLDPKPFAALLEREFGGFVAPRGL